MLKGSRIPEVKVLVKRKRRTKKQREKRKRRLITILLVIAIFIFGYATGHREIRFSVVKEKISLALVQMEKQVDKLDLSTQSIKRKRIDKEVRSEIHLFDLDEAFSVFLTAEDGSNILINTGRQNDSEKEIIRYLDEQIGLGGRIDLLIFTNNLSDHIGHGDLVVEYFDVREVWMNGLDSSTVVYSDLLDAMLESSIDYLEPKAGEKYKRGAFEIEILNPVSGNEDKDHSDESIVGRIKFDGISLVNAASVTHSRENEIVKEGLDLKADIIILGNQESDTDLRNKWLDVINPDFAFYQRKPADEMLHLLKERGIALYGTDESGTISTFLNEEGKLEVNIEKE